MSTSFVATFTITREDASLWKAIVRHSLCNLRVLVEMIVVPIVLCTLIYGIPALGIMRTLETILRLASIFAGISLLLSLLSGFLLSILEYFLRLPRTVTVTDDSIRVESPKDDAAEIPLSEWRVAAGTLLHDDLGEFLTSEPAIVLSNAYEIGLGCNLAIATSNPLAQQLTEALARANVPVGQCDPDWGQIRNLSSVTRLFAAGSVTGFAIGSAVDYTIRWAVGINLFTMGTFLVPIAFCIVAVFHVWAPFSSEEARRIHESMLPRKLSVACGFFSMIGCVSSKLTLPANIAIVVSSFLFGAIAGIVIRAYVPRSTSPVNAPTRPAPRGRG